MLGPVALVRTDVSEELSAFFIRVTRICELGTTLAVTSKRRNSARPSDSDDLTETEMMCPVLVSKPLHIHANVFTLHHACCRTSPGSRDALALASPRRIEAENTFTYETS
jgi:hypothetical protein